MQSPLWQGAGDFAYLLRLVRRHLLQLLDGVLEAVMLPIQGTSKVAHLEENVAAVNIQLSDEEFDALDREGWTEYRQS